MSDYIDDKTKEEFTEDNDIREAIDDIYNMLAAWAKEERISFFESITKPKDLDFVKKVGDVYYVVCSHFDNEKSENIVEKVRRIVLKDEQQ